MTGASIGERMNTLAFLPNVGPTQWVIILVIALLLFGKRLPEVGRSLGKGIVEFKKGLKGIEDEIEQEVNKPQSTTVRPPLTSGGVDARVSTSADVEQPAGSEPKGS